MLGKMLRISSRRKDTGRECGMCIKGGGNGVIYFERKSPETMLMPIFSFQPIFALIFMHFTKS